MRCREMMSGASGARSRMLSGLSCPLRRWVSGPSGAWELPPHPGSASRQRERRSGAAALVAFASPSFFCFSHGARRSPPAQSLPA